MRIFPLLSVLTVSALLTCGVTVRADDDSDDHIEGTASFHGKVVLNATDNAPGASGKAHVEYENEHGTVTGSLEVETKGLWGTLVVSVVKLSDGSSVEVGQFTGSGDSDDDQGDDSSGDDSSGDDSSGDDSSGDDSDSESEAEFVLPAGLDVLDIAQIVVSDGNGVALLVGDLNTTTSQASMKLHSSVKVTAGPAAPAAKGVALLQLNARKGKSAGRFMLNANGVASKAAYSVQVNGSPAASVTSNKNGRVQLRKLPVSLFSVQKVELLDGDGNVALSAKFN